MNRLLSGIWTAVVLLAPGLVFGQGVLININVDEHAALPRPEYIIWRPTPQPIIIHPVPLPVPQSTYKIKELKVEAKISEQIAKVQVEQSFVNTGSTPMEVCFIFPLPYDGAIDRLTLMVDGKEYPAKLIEAKEARRTYEDIVRKNKDPALLEWMGTGFFKTSVFPVPPGAERKVSLRYSQLCRKADGLTDFLFPLSTAKYTTIPVEQIQFQVSLESQDDIKNVYSPSHTIEIKRPDNKHAVITYNGKNEVPTSDFRLMYDVGKERVGTSVLSYRPTGSDEGYFLLLTSPQIKASDNDQPKKTVIIAVDRSGSMSGDKIKQAKDALKFVLNNLHEGDLFNVVAFDSEIESWRPELQKFNDENRKAALGFAEGIYAGGSTNIDGVLKTVLGQLKDSSRPNYVLFLTDGLPTVGETNEAKIIANAKSENQVRARIFAFGVGYDLNARLLDNLVRNNHGQSEFVRPNENIETHVSQLYNRIGSPVLNDVTLKFEFDQGKSEDGTPVDRLYPKEITDLFAGEQLVVVGRYKKSGAAKVKITGKVGSQEQSFDFPANLVESSTDDSYAFIEKLWAVRRVGEILDELDLKGKNEELVKELVSLSTKHGILTPYTSFLADETTNLHSVTENTRRTGQNLEILSTTDGVLGVEQRSAKGAFQKADKPTDAAAQGGDSFRAINEAKAPTTFNDRTGNAPASTPAPGLQGGSFGAGGGTYRFSADKDKASGGQPSSGNTFVGGSVTLGSVGGATMPGSKDQRDQGQVVETQRNVGSKSFYRRDNRWVDAAVNDEQQKKAIKIERFSKEYFALVEKLGKDAAKYLAFDEPVVVEIKGEVYSIEK